RGVGQPGTGRRAHAGEYAMVGAVGPGVRTGRQSRPGSRRAATAGGARPGDLRLTVPRGLCLHGARRARSGDGPAGALLRAACRRGLRYQGRVPVCTPAKAPEIPGAAGEDEPESTIVYRARCSAAASVFVSPG